MVYYLVLSTALLFAPADSGRVVVSDSVCHLPAHIEERRIWHEVLHPQPCRVVVEIFAADGRKVRTFLDRTLGGGIYNWHWDALDDSGSYVVEGTYRAVINDCKQVFYETMAIHYQPGERDFRLADTVVSIEKGISVRVLADSVRLSGSILSSYADFAFLTFGDTLLPRGSHQIPIKSDQIHPGSRVRLHLRTHQLERAFEIELRK